MNYVWPNIFETSPHMMQSFNDAVEGFRVSVGPGKVLQYTVQVSSFRERLYCVRTALRKERDSGSVVEWVWSRVLIGGGHEYATVDGVHVCE